MPKRSPGKQSANGEAAREGNETVARAAEPAPILTSGERRTGAEPFSTKAPFSVLSPTTREKLLYKVASAGTPIGNEFFDQFTDIQEILALSLSISVRLLIVAICNGELAPTQRISAMRCVMALNGKQIPATDEEQSTKPVAPQVHAADISSAQRSIDKIRELM